MSMSEYEKKQKRKAYLKFRLMAIRPRANRASYQYYFILGFVVAATIFMCGLLLFGHH
jgi:hypothetical protein